MFSLPIEYWNDLIVERCNYNYDYGNCKFAINDNILDIMTVIYGYTFNDSNLKQFNEIVIIPYTYY